MIVRWLETKLRSSGSSLEHNQLKVRWDGDSRSLVFSMVGIKFESGDQVSWAGRKYTLLYRQFGRHHLAACWMAVQSPPEIPEPRYLIESALEVEPR